MKILLVAINASYSHTCLAVRALYNYLMEKGGEVSPSLQPPKAFSATLSSGMQQTIQKEKTEGINIETSQSRNAQRETVPQKTELKDIAFEEFTINQPVGEILRGIERHKPDMVLFSTYIWNAEVTQKIIPDVKKLLPEAVVGAGGPEFAFCAYKYLEKLPSLDFICFGEGEIVLTNLCSQMQKLLQEAKNQPLSSFFTWKTLQNVKGLYLRDEKGKIVFTGEQPLICNLGELPFPYPELKNPELVAGGYIDQKMFYYESSRGCPYSCSYCMSSLDKRVRFMPLERVFADLQIFLDANVRIVKFVDRTYNLQPERYIAIWRYILEHHNKKTMFHFEIEAEYLSEEALEFLQSVPAGVMQFEIGVQSANKKTLAAVNRSINIEKLAQNISRIPRTIHQHLDLIAGLPYEDLESFGHSFDFVMALKPDALQLGFLKVLAGTQMEKYALENGWKWMENPVYETFSTPYMPYKDMLFLKDLEICVDAYWNSGKFVNTMNYIGRVTGWWNFFYNITHWAQDCGVFAAARRETFWFELLNKYVTEEWGRNLIQEGEVSPCLQPSQLVAEPSSATSSAGQNVRTLAPQRPEIVYDLLRYDFILRGKQGGFPDWYEHRYDKNAHRKLLEQNGGVVNAREDYAHSEYEVFDFDVTAPEPEKKPGTFEKLVKYVNNGRKKD